MNTRAPAPRPLGKPEYESLAAFRAALRRFAAFSADAARTAGLTPQQHQALLAIKGAPGRDTLTVGELAAALLIRPNTAVELADRLTEQGLLRRDPDPADTRRVYLALTPQAEATLHSLSTAHLHELAAIRPALASLLAQIPQP